MFETLIFQEMNLLRGATCRRLSTATTTATTTSQTPKRRRHRFFDDDTTLTLKDFQQQAQIRNLYRQYLRLIPKSSTELLIQVRTEFRSSHSSDPTRALSEGRRRYKELSAMLSTSSVGSHTSSPQSSQQQTWPWQQVSSTHDPPKAFPPKAALPEERRSE